MEQNKTAESIDSSLKTIKNILVWFVILAIAWGAASFAWEVALKGGWE